MGKPPTILDIAREAKVSKSTVSLALRGSPLTALATRERIQSVAREMGYRPSMIFSIMGSGNRRREHTVDRVGVAYLHDVGGNSVIDGNNLALLMARASDYGLFVEGFNLSSIRSGRKFTQMLYHRGFCGVIIGIVEVPDSIIYRLDLSDFSVVCQGGHFRDQRYHRVREDFFGGIRLAWRKLRAAGYVRIGIAPSRHAQRYIDDDHRLGAALTCLDEIPKGMRIPPFVGIHGDNDGFIEWLLRWRPEAVIGFNAWNYWRMIEAGMRIPEEIGYAQMIVEPESESTAISGIVSTREPSCRSTLSLLDQLIRNRIRGLPEYPTTVQIESQWHPGSTIHCPRRSLA
jgi:DNA-binding LacI/PurR family transcriptional regulator